jgi:hypothetical protein
MRLGVALDRHDADDGAEAFLRITRIEWSTFTRICGAR